MGYKYFCNVLRVWYLTRGAEGSAQLVYIEVKKEKKKRKTNESFWLFAPLLEPAPTPECAPAVPIVASLKPMCCSHLA